jgi:hypothetical protein
MKDYLLFTSAGDNFDLLNNNYNNWNSHQNNNFDIYSVFYGNNKILKNLFKEKSNYFLSRNGSKFQNLVYAYKLNKEIFKKYKFIFVIDNDIEINTLEINFMFNLAKLYNFDIIQPSLTNSNSCRIDHWLMEHNPFLFASKVSFIEVNMPLFKTDLLCSFLEYLIDLNKPILAGFGMDHLYLNFSNNIYKPDIKKVYSIIHGINVINPKNEIREIDLYEPLHKRIQHFETLKNELNLQNIKNVEYEHAYDCLPELLNDYNIILKYKDDNYKIPIEFIVK